MKKAFTIIELLVAMGLLSMLIAISGLVFSTAVKAHRAANATGEIAAKLQAITQQLDADFGGLQKDGEFVVVWDPIPVYTIKDGKFVDKNGDGRSDFPDRDSDGLADQYISFDRVMFFAAGNFQSYDPQPITGVSGMVYGNQARISYSFGKDAENTKAWNEPSATKRMLCRTQHIYATTTIDGVALTSFPSDSEWNTPAWNDGMFGTFSDENFSNEYQTMTMEDWTNKIPIGDGSGNHPIKENMLSIILGLRVSESSITESILETYGGPKVDTDDAQTLHQLFMQGVGQFHVQIWRSDLIPNRWWPEIDINGDSLYADSDYYVDTDNDGDFTDESLYANASERNLLGWWTVGANIGPALKFTFTLHDSNGVFPEGKTFTYIVYLN